ncbi:MAG: hypothetical protein HY459_01845 [Parcubacteria group bacterium]|nr:hypothetical protein [Parcubacteria group bacterium]
MTNTIGGTFQVVGAAKLGEGGNLSLVPCGDRFCEHDDHYPRTIKVSEVPPESDTLIKFGSQGRGGGLICDYYVRRRSAGEWWVITIVIHSEATPDSRATIHKIPLGDVPPPLWPKMNEAGYEGRRLRIDAHGRAH